MYESLYNFSLSPHVLSWRFVLISRNLFQFRTQSHCLILRNFPRAYFDSREVRPWCNARGNVNDASVREPRDITLHNKDQVTLTSQCGRNPFTVTTQLYQCSELRFAFSPRIPRTIFSCLLSLLAEELNINIHGICRIEQVNVTVTLYILIFEGYLVRISGRLPVNVTEVLHVFFQDLEANAKIVRWIIPWQSL